MMALELLRPVGIQSLSNDSVLEQGALFSVGDDSEMFVG